MRQLWQLIRIQLINYLFASRRSRKRKAGRGSKFAAALPFLALVYVSVVYTNLFFESVPHSLSYLVVYLMTGAAALICFIYGVSLALGSLFDFKDYDILMSLPVSKRKVIISKLVSFYLMELLYTAFLLVPALVIYGVRMSPSLLFYLYGLVGLIFLPAVPIVLASLAAAGIRKLASRFKHRVLWTNILSILGFAAFMVVIFRLGYSSQSQMAGTLGAAGRVIELLPNLDWYLKAVLTGSLPWLLASVAADAAVIYLFVMILGPAVIRINAQLRDSYHVRNFQLRKSAGQGILKALTLKELRKFFANIMYMLNMASGQVMILILAVYLLINRQPAIAILQQIGGDAMPYGFLMILLAVMMTGLMSPVAGVSVSLEGKYLWITKSLPIGIRDIFLSKILVNFLIIVGPSLTAFWIIGISFGFPAPWLALGMGFILALAWFVGSSGLVVNLFFPKLDFDREIVVIKQSLSSFVCVMGGLALAAGLTLLYFFVLSGNGVSPISYAAILTAALAIADILLWLYLEKGGKKRFAALYN